MPSFETVETILVPKKTSALSASFSQNCNFCFCCLPARKLYLNTQQYPIQPISCADGCSFVTSSLRAPVDASHQLSQTPESLPFNAPPDPPLMANLPRGSGGVCRKAPSQYRLAHFFRTFFSQLHLRHAQPDPRSVSVIRDDIGVWWTPPHSFGVMPPSFLR